MSEPTYDDVLQFVQQYNCPFVTTKDLAEEFGDISGRTIRKRLNHLNSRGDIKCRKVGRSAKVWYTDD